MSSKLSTRTSILPGRSLPLDWISDVCLGSRMTLVTCQDLSSMSGVMSSDILPCPPRRRTRIEDMAAVVWID